MKPNKKKKDNIQTAAKVAGVLFITATVAYSIAMILLDPILGGVDYLTKVFENTNRVTIGALLVLVDGIAVAGIAIVLYPILKKHNEVLALGYVGARILESILFMLSAIAPLTLLSVSHDFIQAGAPASSYFQTLGTVVLAAGNWAYLIGLGLVFAISALILNFVLYRSKLVPQWISVWGFIGAVLIFINYLLESFGIAPVDLFFYPIAFQEMVFAVWLIAKGFDTAALAKNNK